MDVKTSDETNEIQIALAKAQGDALSAALKHMITEEATGEEKLVDDYLIAYAVEEAEGMYEEENGTLVWHNPTNGNAHIEISVRDAADGRFLPGVGVYVTILNSAGEELQPHELPLLWHPWLYHYGKNVTVSAAGTYSFRVRVEAPLHLMRHDKQNGARFTKDAEVEFHDIKLPLGQKRS